MEVAYQQIDAPRICEDGCHPRESMFTGQPPTISNYQSLEPVPIELEEAIYLTLQSSEVFAKLGGRVVTAPAGSGTVYDPAIQATNPQQSIEAALSAFDAQFTSNLTVNHQERRFNNLFFGGGAPQLTSNLGNFQAELSKVSAAGTRFAVRNITDYNRNDATANLFRSAWDTVTVIEARQPLLRGFGTQVNRIAGPEGAPGVYNGVLIARVRNDISLADFEAAVRDLVRDVEQAYWELYFAYRDLDAKKRALEVARDTWQIRKTLVEGGDSPPDDEALARQQYFNFQTQVNDALVGTPNGLPGVFGAERNLRRLIGRTTYDGQILRPSTDPVIAPINFDWDQAQFNAVERRVELRRQRWLVKQREMELCAAKQLNRWNLDLVGQYGWRGWGDNLFGSRSRTNGSAFDELLQGDLDDWSLGIEFNGPIGNRTGHLAVRNASLQLARERAIMTEQQRQVLHELNAAYTEVDRAFAAIRTNYNTFDAVIDELEPKRARAEAGDEELFFLLSAQQTAAQSESAYHRAVTDYNVALMNFNYSAGELLANYGIYLAEGPWEGTAEIDAMENNDRLEPVAPGRKKRDYPVISQGAVEQVLQR